MDEEFKKKYLLYDLIQEKTKRILKKTNLTYRYDSKNQTNFHNYIDGKHNFLIIVRTMKDHIFGAFSTSKF